MSQMRTTDDDALVVDSPKVPATAAEDKPRQWPAVGVGVGVAIGSAAIVAALLYANRARS